MSQMLSSTPAARPNAAAFSGCQWFQEDMLLRCLKFIDTILQRDTGQKVWPRQYHPERGAAARDCMCVTVRCGVHLHG